MRDEWLFGWKENEMMFGKSRLSNEKIVARFWVGNSFLNKEKELHYFFLDQMKT